MWVKRLEVSDFLSRPDKLIVNFNKDLTVISGRNGAGKTSLLKLIWYVISGNILLALKEVPFSELIVETDRYVCEIKRTGGMTCEISITADGKTYLYKDLKDEDGDVIHNAEDGADPRLQRTGSSVFLPTFRRIEGGFSIESRSGGSGLSSLLSNISKDKSTIEQSLGALSKKLSNKEHIFVSAISTVDVSEMLLKRHADLSNEYATKQSDMSQSIVTQIKAHNSGAKRTDAAPANSLLDSIVAQIEGVENERTTIMAPIEAIQKVVNSIFHHGGISFDQRLNFGDAAAAINSEKLSAGEKQMLSFIAYNGLRENSIFIIDEPELSLHVDWQRQMFGILMAQQTSNQFIIATHSPFIYSQYPDKEAQIVNSRGDDLVS